MGWYLAAKAELQFKRLMIMMLERLKVLYLSNTIDWVFFILVIN